MTITFAWWVIPIILALVGLIGGWIIGSRPESGYFQFNPFIGFVWFVFWVAIGISICIGKALA